MKISVSKELCFFLAKGRDAACLHHDTRRRASVKDIIESLGIPHTEVGLIRYNDGDADFSLVPSNGGLLIVKGIAPPFDVTAPDLLRPEPLGGIRFLADLNVMKLGRYLLFLGYDTLLARKQSDREIARVAEAEQRIVLTRDTRLLFRKNITHARRLRAVHPLDQLAETLTFFGLEPAPKLFFTRCAGCNLPLRPVEKASVYHLLEPKTRRYVHAFRQCPGCGQVFWEGSHHQALLNRLKRRGLLPH